VTSLIHSAFYRFVRLRDANVVAAQVRALASTHALTGSVIVASEGVNGTVAGQEQNVEAFERAITNDEVFEGAFANLVFKRSACNTPPFARMKVHVKERIVAFGNDDDAVSNERNTAVSPEAWRELIARDDVVVIDNRNSFEFRLGRFANAVDPKVSQFSDFKSFVESHANAWKRDGKTVAMYCTGGIRCERVAPWMQGLGLKVAELDGGILNYFATMNDAERDWHGECFVFDNRIALDTKLQQTNTTLETVYEGEIDGEWRIARARRLREAVEGDE
jgi:UPF0176 protein